MEFACLLPSRLRRTPDLADVGLFAGPAARSLAKAWSDARRDPNGVVKVSEVLAFVGCRIDVRPLHAARGGVRATMSPFGKKYWFVVDPEPAPEATSRPGENGLSGDALVQWRLAHELGHVLFRDFDGRRMSPVSDAEEDFCDAFADVLVAELCGLVAA